MMRFFRLFQFASAALLICLQSALPAQDGKPETAKINLTQFAKLPVRFNGRVTTYEVVAKNYLKRFGGRDVAFDGDDKEQPAVRWLLDVMSGHQDRDKWRVFRIENPELVKLLELSPHERAKNTKQHFTFTALLDRGKRLDELSRKISGKRPSQRTKADRELLDLYVEVLAYLNLDMSFRPPEAVNREVVPQVLETLKRLDHMPLPSFVPSEKGRPWMIYYAAYVANLIGKGEKKNPLFLQLVEVLKAHRANDSKSFQTAVEAYAKSVAAVEAIKSPFQMSPPPVWQEIGVEASPDGYLFSDANKVGRQLANMSLAGTDNAGFTINYFQKQNVSRVDLINSWRITLGLAPLPEADLKKTWKTTKLAGREAIRIDIETPDDLELPQRSRYLTTLLQEDDQTLVFSCYGEPRVLETHRGAHRRLMESIQITSLKDLADWAPVSDTIPEEPARDFLAAVIPDGKKVWIFATSDFGKKLDSHRESILRFLRSVKIIEQPNGQSKLDWVLPEDWSQVGDLGEATLLIGQDQNALPMTITPLGEAREDTVHTLVDYWANKINAGKLTDKQRSKSIKEIQIAGRKAFLVELQGKATDAEKPKPKPPAEITHKAPKNWKLQPAGAFLQSSFEVAKDEQTAKVTVASLPTGAKLALNINRWRAQLKLPPQDEKDALKETKPAMVGKLKGTLVDLHNPATEQRILAAVVKHGNKDWYFKMMGDEELVEAERERFEAFLKTVKFPG